MMTLEAAQNTERCRICEQIIVPRVRYDLWKLLDGIKSQTGESIVLLGGKEFAHRRCINKCEICGKELLPQNVPFNVVNVAMYDIVISDRVHTKCKGETKKIEVIRSIADLAAFIFECDDGTPVVILEGNRHMNPVFEIEELPNGVKRLLIRK